MAAPNESHGLDPATETRPEAAEASSSTETSSEDEAGQGAEAAELNVVSGAAEPTATKAASGPGPAPAEGGPNVTSRRKGVSIWALLAVVLVIALIGAGFYLNEYQRAEMLQSQVTMLEGELAVAGEQLEAYQSHLGEVRAGVADLKSQVGALDVLVNRDPLAPAIAAPAAGAASLAEPAKEVAPVVEQSREPAAESVEAAAPAAEATESAGETTAEPDAMLPPVEADLPSFSEGPIDLHLDGGPLDGDPYARPGDYGFGSAI